MTYNTRTATSDINQSSSKLTARTKQNERRFVLISLALQSLGGIILTF